MGLFQSRMGVTGPENPANGHCQAGLLLALPGRAGDREDRRGARMRVSRAELGSGLTSLGRQTFFFLTETKG